MACTQLTSDRVYRWRLILEEYGPEIVYIKRIHNNIAVPKLVAVWTYDTKPAQILSMITMCLRWDVKGWLVWSTAIQKKAIIFGMLLTNSRELLFQSMDA